MKRAERGTVRRHVVVTGRAQGVFFRQSVLDRACSRDVAGWVSNRPDGALEAVFEGSPEGVTELVRFCQEGPRGARVEAVEVESGEQAEGLAGFRVL